MQRILVLAATTASLLAGTAAFAADVVIYDPPPMPVPAPERFDWSGFYVGVFAGVGADDTQYSAVSHDPDVPGSAYFDISANGFLGGIQAGYDQQWGDFVLGAVADIAATGYGPSFLTELPTVPFTANVKSRLKYLGTLRARVGYAMDRTLLYGHGGLAYGRTKQEIVVNGEDLFDWKQGRTGWTVGTGFEFAMMEHLSLGAEYAFVNLGTEEIYRGAVADFTDVSIEERVRFHTLKAMLNVRF